jgi:O-antigen ligase
MPIYEVLILSCLALNLSQLGALLRWQRLRTEPITLCVVVLLPAVFLSNASHLAWYEARVTTLAFLKLVLYYLSLVSLIDSSTRLRQFLILLCTLTLLLTSLALVDYHDIVNVPSLSAYKERQEDQIDEETGEAVVLARLRSTGIYNNPNDLARILVVGTLLSLYVLADRRLGRWRLLAALAIVTFAHALQLTYSRGGLLALLAGLLVLLTTRYGWRRTIAIAGISLPIFMIIFGGRQTNLTTSEGTGHQRIEIWREGMTLFQTAPVFGIGMDRYVEEVGYVAHNSFVQCYTELGFVGGTLFFGAFFLACLLPFHGLRGSARMLASNSGSAAEADMPGPPSDFEAQRFRPYLLAIAAGYVVGMFSSTRSYSLPTYLVLGLAAASERIGGSVGRVNGTSGSRLARRVVAASAAFFVAIYLYVRLSLG